MTPETSTPIVVTGIGMRTSVGQSALQTCAALRAGICRFVEWPCAGLSFGADGIPLSAAPVTPDLGNRTWLDKFGALAVQPFLEAIWMAGLEELTDAASRRRWGLYLALPSPDRPGPDSEDLDAFQSAFESKTLLPLVPYTATSFTQRQAAGLFAVERALDELAAGAVEVAVVGGVDSLLHSDGLAELLEQGRLKTPATPAGLVPGEAGAFVVLELREAAQRRGATPLAALTTVRTGQEAVPAGEPSTGAAIAQVLREVIADAPCGPGGIERVLVDLNGERWRFLEWAMAVARAPASMPPGWESWHPADCVGDVGAATGPLHIGLAARAFQRQYARGQAIPVALSSDSGERAGTCVLPPSPARRG